MKKIFKAIAIALVLLGTILLNNITNVEAADVHVSNYNNLKNNLKAGNKVILDDNITFTNYINIPYNRDGGTVTLDLNGHDLICDGSVSTAMINITNISSNMTVEILDSQANGIASHGFINSENNKNNNRNCRAIQILGNLGKISLNIDSIKFDGFRHAGSAPAINVVGYGYLDNESLVPTIDIKNSTFTNNIANNAGGAMYFNLAKVSLVNNVIENNIAGNNNTSSSAKSGGGVAFLASSITMINNNILYNHADSGGGVYIQSMPGTKISKYEILLKGNKINYNEVNTTKDDSSFGLGGGLQINFPSGTNVDFKIESGEFIGNIAKDGGAIYHGVVWSNDKNNNNDPSKTIYLQKALITGNKAARGGGIWLCPESYLLMHTTLGGAIYNNVATGNFSNMQSGLLQAAGDDVHYEGENGDDKQYEYYARSSITVSDRTWSGNLINWYKDEKDARFSATNRVLANKDYYTNTTNTVSLHGEIEKDQKDATIIIKDNTATQRGGGIFTNNLIVIGDDKDYDIDVTKSFKDYDGPISDKVKVFVNLYQIDADGNEVLLDENVELNDANNWKHTFTDLPKYYLDKSGEQQEYTYEIREVDTDNQISTTCENLNAGNNSCIIENKYAAPVEINPEIEKEVVGNPQEDKTFNFELKAEAQAGMILPNDLEATITGSGTVRFGNITFMKTGTYEFTIQEIAGTNDHYYYDPTIWKVIIVVDEKNNQLVISSIKYLKNNVEAEKVVFVNEYIPDSEGDIEPPKTLDNINASTLMASISLIGIAFLLKFKKNVF